MYIKAIKELKKKKNNNKILWNNIYLYKINHHNNFKHNNFKHNNYKNKINFLIICNNNTSIHIFISKIVFLLTGLK